MILDKLFGKLSKTIKSDLADTPEKREAKIKKMREDVYNHSKTLEEIQAKDAAAAAQKAAREEELRKRQESEDAARELARKRDSDLGEKK